MHTQMLTSKYGAELVSFKINGEEKVHQGENCIDENGSYLHQHEKDQELLPWRGGDRAEPQKSCEKTGSAGKTGKRDFEQQTYDAESGCLSAEQSGLFQRLQSGSQQRM